MNRKVLVISVTMLAAGAVAAFAQTGNLWGNGAMRGQQQVQSTTQAQVAPQFAMNGGPGMPGGRGNAGGRGAQNANGPMMSQRPGGAWGLMADAEEVELSGTLHLSEGEAPTLTVGSKTYTLIVPPVIAAEVDVDDGDRIQVTGVEFEGPDFDLLGGDQIVRVRILQVGNDRYITAGGRW